MVLRFIMVGIFGWGGGGGPFCGGGGPFCIRFGIYGKSACCQLFIKAWQWLLLGSAFKLANRPAISGKLAASIWFSLLILKTPS